MKVGIPTPLRGYTKADTVDARGETLDALLCDLDSRFPGFRFRVVDEQARLRPHVRVFVNKTRHHLVPKHERLTELPTGLRAEHLPKLLDSDPIAQYYDFPIGSIVKITRVFGGHQTTP